MAMFASPVTVAGRKKMPFKGYAALHNSTSAPLPF